MSRRADAAGVHARRPAADSATWLELIHQRASWRTFLPEPVDAEARRALEAAMEPSQTPFPATLRFRLLDLNARDVQTPKRIGTYGTIRGARTYVVGAVTRGVFDLEMFGFAMEKIILTATRMGLGTCWLGGAFSRSDYAVWLGAGSGEVLPAITPVGPMAEQRNLVDRVIRFSAGARTRKPWEALFFDGVFGRPLARVPGTPLTELLEAVRVGPSASNRQPWRLVCEEGGARVHLILQRSPGYRRVSGLALGSADLQRLDMGIAMCHLSLAAETLGLRGEWITARPEIPELPVSAEYTATWQAALV